MPPEDLKALLERIHTRLDESFVGIGRMLAVLPEVDQPDLINKLKLSEAGAVVSMLLVARTIEIFDDTSMGRRDADLEELEPARVAEILAGLSADELTDNVQKM